MNRTGIFKTDNASGLITLAVFAVLLACLPLTLRLDERIDRNRPMYDDLARMTAVQAKSLAATGKVVPVQLSGGESVTIADTEYVASDGVTVDVRGVDGDTAYCIAVSNQYGAKSEHCS